MHNIHIKHLGANSITGTVMKETMNFNEKAEVDGVFQLDDVIHVAYDTISDGINLREQAFKAAVKFNTDVVVERHGDKPDLLVRPYSVNIQGMYAPFYAGSEVALLQKEANSFDVRQGQTFEDEVYIDCHFTGNRVEIDEEDQFYLVSGNLCVVVQNGHPRPLDNRHVDLSFISDDRIEQLHADQDEKKTA